MPVNPHAWLSTLPLTLLLVAVYFQPSDNVLKRWWSAVHRLESDLWLQLSGSDSVPTPFPPLLRTVAYWSLVAFLAIGSLCSLSAYAGTNL